MSEHTVEARVQCLEATVRTLMVGSRQVTLSVFNQLDWVEVAEISPMGRVRARDGEAIIGADRHGNLVKARFPAKPDIVVRRGTAAHRWAKTFSTWKREDVWNGRAWVNTDVWHETDGRMVTDEYDGITEEDDLMEALAAHRGWDAMRRDLELIVLAGLR